MPEPIKPNSRIRDTEKQGQRVADRMATNINKSTPPENILSISNAVDILEKQFTEQDYVKVKNITGRPTKKQDYTITNVSNYKEGLAENLSSIIPASWDKSKILTGIMQRPKHEVFGETHPKIGTSPVESSGIRATNIQNSLINKNGTGPDIFSKKNTIKQPKEITLQTEESQYIPDKKISKIPEEQHKLRLNPHTLTGGTASTVKYPKISREAIMQNSEIINKEVKEPFAIATARAKEMGYDDFSEGSEGRAKRDEIAEAIKEKEGIPISKAILLCKLEKQIFQLENGGIPDDYILKAYGTFDSIPEDFRKQENRPPIGWFEKALENIVKSDYSGNAHRYCIELWKSSDTADELMQKTMGVSSVKPLDDDEIYKRDRLVDTTAEGGEAEEILGDGTKVRTTDIAPIKVTSTN